MNTKVFSHKPPFIWKQLLQNLKVSNAFNSLSPWPLWQYRFRQWPFANWDAKINSTEDGVLSFESEYQWNLNQNTSEILYATVKKPVFFAWKHLNSQMLRLAIITCNKLYHCSKPFDFSFGTGKKNIPMNIPGCDPIYWIPFGKIWGCPIFSWVRGHVYQSDPFVKITEAIRWPNIITRCFVYSTDHIERDEQTRLTRMINCWKYFAKTQSSRQTACTKSL